MAARFPDRRRASAALSELQRRLGLSARDAAIAPLGTPGERSDTETVLAGRFDETDAQTVVWVVDRSGGEIVADVDERWTVSRSRAAKLTVRSPIVH